MIKSERERPADQEITTASKDPGPNLPNLNLIYKIHFHKIKRNIDY